MKSSAKKKAKRTNRTGCLIPRKNKDGRIIGYSARITISSPGEDQIREQHDLKTDSPQRAQLELRRLLRDGAPALEHVETFKEAAERIVPTQSITSKIDRLHRLKEYAYPAIGNRLVTELKAVHVRECYLNAKAAGKSLVTIKHLRIDISRVLAELVDEGVISQSYKIDVCAASLPDAPKDKRRRLQLNDDEFMQFVAVAPIELATMAILSRYVGGLRTSDALRGLRWEQVDLATWRTMTVVRPKTQDTAVHVMAVEASDQLVRWWLHEKEPKVGPIFPVRKGKHAGQERTGKFSFAADLRAVLQSAGITRPLQPREGERQIDWHSFRRQYCTALASADVPTPIAMQLAGHKSAATHVGYVDRAKELQVPAAALPGGSRSRE